MSYAFNLNANFDSQMPQTEQDLQQSLVEELASSSNQEELTSQSINTETPKYNVGSPISYPTQSRPQLMEDSAVQAPPAVYDSKPSRSFQIQVQSQSQAQAQGRNYEIPFQTDQGMSQSNQFLGPSNDSVPANDKQNIIGKGHQIYHNRMYGNQWPSERLANGAISNTIPQVSSEFRSFSREQSRNDQLQGQMLVTPQDTSSRTSPQSQNSGVSYRAKSSNYQSDLPRKLPSQKQMTIFNDMPTNSRNLTASPSWSKIEENNMNSSLMNFQQAERPGSTHSQPYDQDQSSQYSRNNYSNPQIQRLPDQSSHSATINSPNQNLLRTIIDYMNKIGTPITSIPRLALPCNDGTDRNSFLDVNLTRLFSMVYPAGGFTKFSNPADWITILYSLGIFSEKLPANQEWALSAQVQQIYQSFLLPYENHLMSLRTGSNSLAPNTFQARSCNASNNHFNLPKTREERSYFFNATTNDGNLFNNRQVCSVAPAGACTMSPLNAGSRPLDQKGAHISYIPNNSQNQGDSKATKSSSSIIDNGSNRNNILHDGFFSGAESLSGVRKTRDSKNTVSYNDSVEKSYKNDSALRKFPIRSYAHPDFKSLTHIGHEISTIRPTYITLPELGNINIHAITKSLQSGLPLESNYALNILVLISNAVRWPLPLRDCGDLMESLCDTLELQIYTIKNDLDFEISSMAKENIFMLPFNHWLMKCEDEISAISTSHLSPTYARIRSANDQLCSVLTILANFSFKETNQDDFVNSGSILPACMKCLEFLLYISAFESGRHTPVLNSYRQQTDFIKDLLILISHIVQGLYLSQVRTATSLIHFILSFSFREYRNISAPYPISLSNFDLAENPYAPAALDILAKILARDNSNRPFLDQVIGLHKVDDKSLWTRSFAFAMMFLPLSVETLDNVGSLVSICESRLPIIEHSLLVIDQLLSYVFSVDALDMLDMVIPNHEIVFSALLKFILSLSMYSSNFVQRQPGMESIFSQITLKGSNILTTYRYICSGKYNDHSSVSHGLLAKPVLPLKSKLVTEGIELRSLITEVEPWVSKAITTLNIDN